MSGRCCPGTRTARGFVDPKARRGPRCRSGCGPWLLFGSANLSRGYTRINRTDSEAPSFRDLNIAPERLAAIEALGWTTPTPIQAKAIPAGLSGQDVVGIAQTGTGKT
ncbi:MAG: DEAD/DEAH box helicase, partial [Longimicrobiales bacterium]